FVPSLALAPLFCLSPPACRVLVFFFSGPRPPRHLHSFPTRRSSDVVDQLQRVVDEVRRGLPPASSARGTALLAFRHGVPPVVTLPGITLTAGPNLGQWPGERFGEEPGMNRRVTDVAPTPHESTKRPQRRQDTQGEQRSLDVHTSLNRR